MALKPSTLNTLSSNTLRNNLKDIRVLFVPSLVLLVISLALVVAFGTTVANFSAAPQTLTANNPSFSLSSSGALNVYLDGAEVTCGANKLSFNLPAVNGLNGYQLSLASPINLEQTTNLSLNQTNLLSFSLTDASATPYQSFTASKGEVVLQGSQGHLSALLENSQGQQLFLNSSWTCS